MTDDLEDIDGTCPDYSDRCVVARIPAICGFQNDRKPILDKDPLGKEAQTADATHFQAIEGDEKRKFVTFLIIFPHGTVLDNAVLAGPGVSMLVKTNVKTELKMGKAKIFGAVTIFSIAEKGGRITGITKDEEDLERFYS